MGSSPATPDRRRRTSPDSASDISKGCSCRQATHQLAHTFSSETSVIRSSLVIDRVEYAVWGGSLVDRLFVARDVRTIFDYRRRLLAERFETAAS